MDLLPPKPIHPPVEPSVKSFGLTLDELKKLHEFKMNREAFWENALKQRESMRPKKPRPNSIPSVSSFILPTAPCFIPFLVTAIFLGRENGLLTFLIFVSLHFTAPFILRNLARSKFQKAEAEWRQHDLEMLILEQERKREEKKLEPKLRDVKAYLEAYKLYESELNRFRYACIERERALSLTKKKFWTSMSGFQFEEELGKLLRMQGFLVKVTKKSGDGGVDIIAKRNSNVLIIQCKGHKKPIGIAPLRQLYGVKEDFGAKSFALASFAGVAKNARAWADAKGIQIWDADDISQVAQGRFMISDSGKILRKQGSPVAYSLAF